MTNESGKPLNQTTHELKTWPPYFDAVLAGRKTFEVRWNDRGFQCGDILVLRRYDPDHGCFTHTFSPIMKRVSYVLPGGEFGIEAGWVVMGLQDL